MSQLGKNGFTFRKQDLVSSRNTVFGTKKVVFSHSASGGETSIDLSNLTASPLLGIAGFPQPSATTLLGLQLLSQRSNLQLFSTLRNTLLLSSYTVQSNTVINFNGFSLEEGEVIIGVVDNNPIRDVQLIEGSPVIGSGTLAIGQDTFAVGAPFNRFANPSQQVGDVLVTRNGILQARTVDNTFNTEGNYIEVGSGDTANAIQFRNAPTVQDDFIIVYSPGPVVERVTGSVQSVQSTQGAQIDQIIPVVAQLSGLPASFFQAAPNDTDLSTFGNRVIALEEPGVGGPLIASNTQEGAVLKNRVQTKILASAVNSPGLITALSFSNLVVGRVYRVTGQASFLTDTGGIDPSVRIQFFNGSEVGRTNLSVGETTDSNTDSLEQQVCFTFVAVAEDLLTFADSASANALIQGNGARSGTFVQLEELNNYEETTAFDFS